MPGAVGFEDEDLGGSSNGDLSLAEGVGGDANGALSLDGGSQLSETRPIIGSGGGVV
jgi:hypothetical protein